MISYMKAMVKILKGFEHFVKYDALSWARFNKIWGKSDDQIVIWLQNVLQQTENKDWFMWVFGNFFDLFDNLM
jgi:hypothetical protein